LGASCSIVERDRPRRLALSAIRLITHVNV
jgi:hypothetical protein